MQSALLTFGLANLAAGVAAAWLCDRFGVPAAAGPVPGTGTQELPHDASDRNESVARDASSAVVGELLTNWGFDSPPQFVTLVAAQLLASERLRGVLVSVDSQLRSDPNNEQLGSLLGNAAESAATWRQLAAAAAEAPETEQETGDAQQLKRLSRDASAELSELIARLVGDPADHDARLVGDPRLECTLRLLHLTYTIRDALQRLLAGRSDALPPADRAMLCEQGPSSFEEVLEWRAELNREQPGRFAVWLALDRFRRLNQQAGAARSDALIRGCRGIFDPVLETHAGAGPLRHLGGPDFAITCTGGHEDVTRLAELLRQTLEAASFEASDQTWELTASIAVVPLESPSAELLEDRVQRALAAARAAGSNRTCFDNGDPSIVSPAPQPVSRQLVALDQDQPDAPD